MFEKIKEWYQKHRMPKLPERQKLTPAMASFFADYFHCEEYAPDYDGYVGQYCLPKEVMEIYKRRYGEERGWGEDDA